MKNLIKLITMSIFILLVVFLTACGGGGGSGGDKTASKRLFSEWVERESGYNFSFDLTDAQMGLNIFAFYGTKYPYRVEDGFGWCSYELTIIGNQSSGTYALENGVQHDVDLTITTGFSCSLMEGMGTYKIRDNILELCDVVGCSYYE